MSDETALRQKLEHLTTVLPPEYVRLVRPALDGTAQDLRSFLVSNTLWGGSGSIADGAGIDRDGRERGNRREVEAALVDLGEEQIRRELVNQRTQMWVAAFRSWRERDT